MASSSEDTLLPNFQSFKRNFAEVVFGWTNSHKFTFNFFVLWLLSLWFGWLTSSIHHGYCCSERWITNRRWIEIIYFLVFAFKLCRDLRQHVISRQSNWLCSNGGVERVIPKYHNWIMFSYMFYILIFSFRLSVTCKMRFDSGYKTILKRSLFKICQIICTSIQTLCSSRNISMMKINRIKGSSFW